MLLLQMLQTSSFLPIITDNLFLIYSVIFPICPFLLCYYEITVPVTFSTLDNVAGDANSNGAISGTTST